MMGHCGKKNERIIHVLVVPLFLVISHRWHSVFATYHILDSTNVTGLPPFFLDCDAMAISTRRVTRNTFSGKMAVLSEGNN